jgi:hypothetical protein
MMLEQLNPLPWLEPRGAGRCEYKYHGLAPYGKETCESMILLRKPTAAIVSLIVPVVTVGYLLSVFAHPRGWPRGESGLTALAAAWFWTVPLSIAGFVGTGLSFSRREPVAWSLAALLVNIFVVAAILLYLSVDGLRGPL